jgi:sterol 3beta-glucosyltransferase
MAPEEEFKKRVMHKLTKRRKERHRATIDMPERFRDGEDADEDCTAPRGANAYMNQSVFGMIAAAGSQADFNARFDTISSDDEEDPTQPRSKSSGTQPNEAAREQATTSTKGKHRQNLSDFAVLGPGEESQSPKPASESPSRAPSPALELPSDLAATEAPAHQLLSNDGSVMKRMLDARAELSMRPSFDMPRPTEAEVETEGSESLAKRLMEIFGFDSPEPVLSGKGKIFA